VAPRLPEIKKDFEKLYYFKAQTKIMICDSPQFVASTIAATKASSTATAGLRRRTGRFR